MVITVILYYQTLYIRACSKPKPHLPQSVVVDPGANPAMAPLSCLAIDFGSPLQQRNKHEILGNIKLVPLGECLEPSHDVAP